LNSKRNPDRTTFCYPGITFRTCKFQLAVVQNFRSKYAALKYIKRNLKNSNFDTGYCQINSWWLKRLNINVEKLLDKNYNIDLAVRIYKDNLRICKNDIYCALSMYNTGKKNSSIGKRYANRVLKNRKKLYYN